MSIIKNNTFCKLFEVIDGDVQGQVLLIQRDNTDTEDELSHLYFLDIVTEIEGVRMTLGLGFKDEKTGQDAFDTYTEDKALAIFKEAKAMILEASVGEDQEAS